ncbi:MAG: DUF1302 family protein [Halioglobus sp.]
MKNIFAGAALSTGLLAALVGSVQVRAMEFEFDEFLLNVDTTLGAAAQWRTESRDKRLGGSDTTSNFNDGNNNFDPGLISARGNLILEVGGEYRDFSFFVRGDAVYDWVYAEEETDMSDLNYLTYNGGFPAGGSVAQGDFPRETVAEHGRRTRLLDAFVGYNFSVAEQSGAVRLGRQVISWGEATFFSGINSLQNPIDAVAALSPGAEVREILLPTSAVDLKWDFTNSFGMEAYYKLDWQASTLPGVGSYLSSSDTTGPGAEKILLGPLGAGDITRAQKPEDDDQWGLAARYMTDDGANYELYYIRAHANIPGQDVEVDLNTSSGTAWEVYTEDIDVWSASFSTNLAEAQVYLDAAYSDNMPFIDLSSVLGDDGVLTRSEVVRGHYWQASAGFTDIYTALPWLSEQITVLGEVHYQGNNLGGSRLVRPPAAGFSPGPGDSMAVTDTAWGYQLLVRLQYYAVLPGLDLTVPINFKHDVDGYGNAIALNNGLKEDQKVASLGVDAFYLTNWQFSAKYSWYFGNNIPEDRVLSDRDNIAISMKYLF